MDKRSYNIFFHLHTVTGIVISVLLYVIFFAGSFSFFRSDIIAWERAEPAAGGDFSLDVDTALDSLGNTYHLAGRDIAFYKPDGEKRVSVSLSASKDTLLGKEATYFYLDTDNYRTYNYEDSYTLGEFLYRLHFFAQIPYPAGYYLSGFTSLFFLFAILTGIVVHWRKIVSNFWLFRPREKLKTVWTDAHTVLGTIGLPFQVVYAITGAFFMINVLLVVPSLIVMYDGDQQKLYNDLGFGEPAFTFENRKLSEVPPVNDFVAKTRGLWDDFNINEVHIFNYGDEGMHVEVGGALDHSVKFTGLGHVIYKASTGAAVDTEDPHERTSYLNGVKGAIYYLHFGNYGGYSLRIISFVLGLITCFVIITGVLIWLEARNKKDIPEKQRRFNARVGHIYLAICLTMFPVTALGFIVTQLLPHDLDDSRQTILYSVYFGTWLLLSVFFALRRDNYLTNKYTLLSGAIAGLAVPIVNGLVTGNWFWDSFTNNHIDLFVVDVGWILISLTAFYVLGRLRRSATPKERQVPASDETVVRARGNKAISQSDLTL